MAVGICTLRLSMPLNQDLKAKRRVLQSVIAHVRAAFNVSIAEVGEHDKWQVATRVSPPFLPTADTCMGC